MSNDYYYIILKNPYDLALGNCSNLPIIQKIEKSKWPRFCVLEDKNEGEGPFDSIFELKRKSFILSGITLQKHKQRILKSSNIEKIKDFIFIKGDESFSKSFMDGFSHITVGKFSDKQLKGVHFFNPNTTRIIEVIDIDSVTQVYSARIEQFNRQSCKWIPKTNFSTFFPDSWTMNKLFHECDFAYKNKIKIDERIFNSRTSNGILVKFIIDNDDKIITFYPILEKK